MTAPPLAPARSRSGAARAAWIGLAVALAILAASMLVPAITGWQVFVDFPPLHAEWLPVIGAGTIPAILLAVLAVRFAVDLARRIPWGILLLGSFGAAVAWLVSLATVRGLDGIGAVLDLKSEYLATARRVDDVGAMLREYISRIPLDAPDHAAVHVAGHPPGALLFFVLLVAVGLGSGLAAGTVVLVLAATTPVAVLITLRRLGAEEGARRAAPFLVFGSAAIWMAVSADGFFGAVAAWGLCCLALAATSASRRATAAWGTGAGLLLGFCALLSYGLPLLGILAAGILVVARSWRPLGWATGAALVVVLGFAVAGFPWWEAYPVLTERYWSGIAQHRPFGYWVWGDLGALVFSAGPIVGAAIALVAVRLRRLAALAVSDRAIVVLVCAAVATILVADLSGMSKAEVERIWLPFVPWLLIGTALLNDRWRRGGLALQVIFALLVEHLFFTTW